MVLKNRRVRLFTGMMVLRDDCNDMGRRRNGHLQLVSRSHVERTVFCSWRLTKYFLETGLALYGVWVVNLAVTSGDTAMRSSSFEVLLKSFLFRRNL